MNGSSCEGISNKCFISDEEIRLKNHLAYTFLTNYIVYIEIISTSNQGNFFLKAPKMSTCDPSRVGEGCVSFSFLKTTLPLPSGRSKGDFRQTDNFTVSLSFCSTSTVNSSLFYQEQ